MSLGIRSRGRSEGAFVRGWGGRGEKEMGEWNGMGDWVVGGARGARGERITSFTLLSC